MHLYIVTSVLRPEEKQLLQQASRYGIKAVHVSTEQIVLEGKEDFSTGSVFLIRTPSYFQSTQISFVLESLGYTVFNKHWQLSIFGQKVLTDAWLMEHGLPTIPSAFAFSMTKIEQIAKRLSYPLVLKPNIGGFGKLVHIIRDSVDFRQACDYIWAFAPSFHKVVYAQKYIDVVTDVRALILGGKVIATMERVNDNALSKNIAQGGIGRVYSLNQTTQITLDKLCQILPQGFLGVDILIDREGNNYICEINAVCRFSEISKICDTSIVDVLLKDLMSKT